MRKSNKQTWFFNVIICKHSGVFFIIFCLIVLQMTFSIDDRRFFKGLSSKLISGSEFLLMQTMTYRCRLFSLRAGANADSKLVIFLLSVFIYLCREVARISLALRTYYIANLRNKILRNSVLDEIVQVD